MRIAIPCILVVLIGFTLTDCGKSDLRKQLAGTWRTVGVKCTTTGACERHQDPLTIEFRSDSVFVLEGNRMSYTLKGSIVSVPVGENVMTMEILAITADEMLARTTSSLGLSDIEKYKRVLP